ncbi:zf-RanBP domain protein [Rhizoctonia solani AG-3 Rhs1AP]|uniref:Zf-RanBP domain protein n=1 Tax=Rhizoctonia solani AG-3 Rhs1AP TaxID=1086054 RepID=A0A0A1UK14_9AGAM|nr:zf-RanBP domain protein [Rhizoctonia solani AG-3 Rhs1AP]
MLKALCGVVNHHVLPRGSTVRESRRFETMLAHGRNVHELFISSTSRVLRMYNLGMDAATAIASLLNAHGIMLPVSAWSLHEQFGGAPPGHESSIWCVFRTHDDACRALRLNGLTRISIASALEEDLQPFTKLRRFDMFDEIESSMNINFNLAPRTRTNSVLYSSGDDMYFPTSSPPKNGYLTPPTPTTALSSCGSSSDDGASPPSSTLSLYGSVLPINRNPHMFERRPSLERYQRIERAPASTRQSLALERPTPGSAQFDSTLGFMISTNPPSPRPAFKQGDWICLTPSCTAHNFGRNMTCIACGAPRPLDIGMSVPKPSTDYDRYFDSRASLPLSPPPPRRFDSTPTGGKQPPRLPSILTPSGRAFARGGRIQNVSPIPAIPLIMFWPDNEPLPQASQIRPPFAPGAHPPIMNTGNRGPVEHQPGDWFCGKCSYMNWRRRKVCQTCYPFAEGNADSVPASAQAERINMLAQMAGADVFNSTEPAGLGLNLSPLSPPTRNYTFPPKNNNLNSPDSLASSFGSMSLASASHSPSYGTLPLNPPRASMLDRRASVDHAFGTGRPMTNHVLRTRQSDAALRLSGAPFAMRTKGNDGLGLGGVREGVVEGLGLGLGTRRSPEEADAGLTYGLGRRTSAANIWATDNAPKSFWPTDLHV